MRIFLAALASAAGTFALLCGLLLVATRDVPGDDMAGGLIAGMLFVVVCAIMLPVVLLLHVGGLLLGRNRLERLSFVGLLHTSFVFPVVPALLVAYVYATPLCLWIFYTIPELCVFFVFPAFYVLTLAGWLALLDRYVLSPAAEYSRRSRVLLAILLGYGAWAYWPKVPWRKLVLAIAIHVVASSALVLLLAWFWDEYIELPLGPIPDGYVPLLALVPVTLGVWVWAIRDAARGAVVPGDRLRLRSIAPCLAVVCLVGLCLAFRGGMADGPQAVFELKHGSRDGKQGAAWMLHSLAKEGRLDPITRRRAVAALVKGIVVEKDDGIRLTAAGGMLAPFGESAAGLLAQRLDRGTAEQKKRACAGLGQLGPPGADPLLAALDDRDAEIRLHAAAALAHTGDPRAPGRLATMIAAGDADTGKKLAAALGQIGEAAVPALLEVLDSPDEGVRYEARSALVRIKSPAVPHLISALRGAGTQKRACIAMVLGESRDHRATAPLVALLKDPEDDVRERAARGLFTLADPAAADALLDVLKDPAQNYDTKYGAALAFKVFKDERAVPLLAGLFKTPGHQAHYMREAAIVTLGEIAPKAAAQLLMEVFGDAEADEHVCRDALAAAQRTKDPRLVLPIVGVLRRRSPLQAHAARVLGEIGDSRATDALVALLNQPASSFHLHENTVTALGKLGDPRATDTLIAVLDRPRLSYEMWDATTAALGKIGGEKAVLRLIRVVEENQTSHGVYRSVEALGKTGDRRAVEPIMRVMAKATEFGIQNEAGWALHRLTGQQSRTPAEWQAWWTTNATHSAAAPLPPVAPAHQGVSAPNASSPPPVPPGATPGQVEETLGKPKGQFAAGGLTIWTYPQVEVEFRDGVVSQVQWRKTPPAPERPAATNAVAEDRSRQQTEEPTRLKKPVRERSPGGTARSASSLPSPSVEPANRSPPSRSPASSPQGVEAVANPIKVMVLSFDPPVPSEGGKRVHEAVQSVVKSPWNDPRKLADACISDFVAASSGNAGFTIAIWKDMDELPRSINGKQYTPDQYIEALRAAVKDRWNFWAWPGWLVHESRFDYGHYIARENLADKVRSGQIDEVS